MSFLYQITAQSQAENTAPPLQFVLQPGQYYRLSWQDNQLLLQSQTVLTNLTAVQQGPELTANQPNTKLNNTPNSSINGNNTAITLVLFGDNLSWQLLQQVLRLVAQPGQFLAMRCSQPHADLALGLELSLSEQLANRVQQQIAKLADLYAIERLYLPSRPSLSQPGLLVMDMDSTAIEIECIDEIARLAGVGEQVAKVTAQAMNGELDFSQSLVARVAALQGADNSILEQVLVTMPIMPGLEALVRYLKQHQWHIAIASGGFTYFTQALQQRFGLTATFANQLDIVNGKLTGAVLGDIVDAQAKAEVVQNLAKQYQVASEQTVAIGDGANDIPMLNKAHYGVAFHAKAAVQAQAKYAIKQGSLLQLLYLFSS
ncbi:phosphoserine phosphatase SerB [Rheinheimera sp. WS51]|uniref:phosphoserine phosphatase SerB n=1 Tax=Rheinheimera sp. WS51 TaxID=3425886 RepID=UPI003D940393